MKQPHCFVITHSTSRVFTDCANSLQKYHWNFTAVDATDGWKLTEQSWNDIDVKIAEIGKMKRRPGAQGCWFSHWHLWQQCITTNSPMVIMEHDALVLGTWPEDLVIDDKIIKLYSTADCKRKQGLGLYSKGSHAYTITPAQAHLIVNFVRKKGAVAVDKQLSSAVVPWQFYSSDLVTLHPKRGKSTTHHKTLGQLVC
jgi:hypothetical protein